jgi:Secretion system C-terminal sorting domain
MTVSDDYVFAGTPVNGGVWRRPLSDISEVNDESIPIKYQLDQNYPNPFNPSTKISWQSPAGSWQTLKIYDVLGNEVATLVDEYKPAGSYEVEWNASGLPSGVYFYQLKSGEFVSTKKMILLK